MDKTNKKRFLMKVLNYVDGKLDQLEWRFYRLEDALTQGAKAACHSYKIYNEHGELCHDSHEHKHEHDHSYA